MLAFCLGGCRDSSNTGLTEGERPCLQSHQYRSIHQSERRTAESSRTCWCIGAFLLRAATAESRLQQRKLSVLNRRILRDSKSTKQASHRLRKVLCVLQTHPVGRRLPRSERRSEDRHSFASFKERVHWRKKLLFHGSFVTRSSMVNGVLHGSDCASHGISGRTGHRQRSRCREDSGTVERRPLLLSQNGTEFRVSGFRA